MGAVAFFKNSVHLLLNCYIFRDEISMYKITMSRLVGKLKIYKQQSYFIYTNTFQTLKT